MKFPHSFCEGVIEREQKQNNDKRSETRKKKVKGNLRVNGVQILRSRPKITHVLRSSHLLFFVSTTAFLFSFFWIPNNKDSFYLPPASSTSDFATFLLLFFLQRSRYSDVTFDGCYFLFSFFLLTVLSFPARTHSSILCCFAGQWICKKKKEREKKRYKVTSEHLCAEYLCVSSPRASDLKRLIQRYIKERKNKIK